MIATPQMQSAEYEGVLRAFTDGTITSKDSKFLQSGLMAIAMNVTGDDGVQARDTIQAQTINHILLQRHIDGLNRQNSKTQKLVIALTFASLIGTGAQVWYAAKADKTPEATAPAVAAQPQKLVPQLASPSQAIPPTAGQPAKKTP